MKVSLQQICTFIVFMLSLVCYGSTSVFLKLLSLIMGHLSYKFSPGVTVVRETLMTIFYLCFRLEVSTSPIESWELVPSAKFFTI